MSSTIDEYGTISDNVKKLLVLRLIKRFDRAFRDHILEREAKRKVDSMIRRFERKGKPMKYFLFTESMLNQCAEEIWQRNYREVRNGKRILTTRVSNENSIARSQWGIENGLRNERIFQNKRPSHNHRYSDLNTYRPLIEKSKSSGTNRSIGRHHQSMQLGKMNASIFNCYRNRNTHNNWNAIHKTFSESSSLIGLARENQLNDLEIWDLSCNDNKYANLIYEFLLTTF